MDDLQALRQLKSGDISGLEILVVRYQRKAVHTAYLITHDVQLAEDVAQDTFVRIFQRIDLYDETRPFAPYLLRSVANAALNAVEKTSRWVQYGAGTDVQHVCDLLHVASSVEEQAEASRLKGEVARALAGGIRLPALVTVLFHPWVVVGLGLYAGAALVWLLVLSRVDVSLAYPFVGLGFVVTMVLAWAFLGEAVTPMRMAGTLLIAAGIVVLART